MKNVTVKLDVVVEVADEYDEHRAAANVAAAAAQALAPGVDMGDWDMRQGDIKSVRLS